MVTVVPGDGQLRGAWRSGGDWLLGGDRAASDGPACETIDRMNGHLVVIPTAGRAVYTVDFVDHLIEPGVLLHVHPGQVVSPPDEENFEADLVLISPAVAPIDLFDGALVNNRVDPGPAGTAIMAVVDDIAREEAAVEPDGAVLAAAARYLLHRLAGSNEPEPAGSHQELLRSFRSVLERRYFSTRSVGQYAAAIGASSKTLSRATSSGLGCSPKEVIDRRVVLEAKRLLAHTGHLSSTIGTMLGFSEPTNFTKFFVRHTGLSPQEFRAMIQ